MFGTKDAYMQLTSLTGAMKFWLILGGKEICLRIDTCGQARGNVYICSRRVSLIWCMRLMDIFFRERRSCCSEPPIAVILAIFIDLFCMGSNAWLQHK